MSDPHSVSTVSSVMALAAVREALTKAALSAKREPGSVNLVAVSKTFSAEQIEPVIAAGQRIFGENRVQEAKAKWPALKARVPDLKLHLIGPLQSNKVREAVELFDAIHTIDRMKIAQAVASELQRQGKALDLFVQVNTGEEPQKAGVAPRDAVAFVTECRDTLGLPIAGLMCIPPVEEEPAVHFALLDKLAWASGVRERSMGMSADFETAIAFGATYVRIGSAIFGGRGAMAASQA